MAPLQAPDPMMAALFQLILPLLASLQLGSLLTWGLQGILCVQVYNYYLSFPNDPLHMKFLVYFTLLIEIAQTVMVTRDTFQIFAIGYGNLQHVDNLHLLWLTLPILGGVVGLFCHLIFAYRISVLSNSKIVGGAVVVLSVLASASAFVFGAKLYSGKVLSRAVYIRHIYLVCGLWNGTGAAADLMIAACLSYYLTKSQTGFRHTDVLIKRIVRLAIETGIATATASIASAVLFVGFRSRLDVLVYFVIPAIMITKLYAITILATFNNRPHAVGGPPPLSDSDNYFDETKTFSVSRSYERKAGTEIRIGRTVVQQTWKDDPPLEHIEMFSSADEALSEDGTSTKKTGDLTPVTSTDTR